MGFSNQERINFNSKALAASVVDANPVAQWYETRNPFVFMMSGTKILLQLSSIPVAANLATARTNATNNPTLLDDLSQNSDAVRLTAVAGTNDTTYIAYNTYNNPGSGTLDNWMQPQLVLQSSGAASIGYAIQLYDGDPAGSGTLVTTTDGTTGTGQNKTVGWIFNYAGGLLFLSEDFKSSISDPYIVGFRYIGTTANSLTSASNVSVTYTADQTLAIGDIVRFVTSTDGGGLSPGRIIKANATTGAQSDPIGVCTSAGVQSVAITVVCMGDVATKIDVVPPSSSNGKTVYLQTTDGTCTLTPPSATGNSVIKIGKLTGGNGSTSTPAVFIDIDEIMVIG